MNHLAAPRLVAPKQATARLLILDEDPARLVGLSEIMAEEGFEVIGCAAAEMALERARTAPEIAVAILNPAPGACDRHLVDRFRAANNRLQVIVNAGEGDAPSSTELVRLVHQAAAQHAREHGDQELRRFLDRLPVAAYTCALDGRITYYNEGAVELWGRHPALNARDALY